MSLSHTEPDQDGLAPDLDAESVRERRWAFFESDCREFAASEPDGFAAVLRAVARAMKDQQELLS